MSAPRRPLRPESGRGPASTGPAFVKINDWHRISADNLDLPRSLHPKLPLEAKEFSIWRHLTAEEAEDRQGRAGKDVRNSLRARGTNEKDLHFAEGLKVIITSAQLARHAFRSVQR